LQHQIRGELFIFDSLEKDQGKVSLKGHLFDEMRTQLQPIAIPIAMDKKMGQASEPSQKRIKLEK
jgi:hypothetical protein